MRSQFARFVVSLGEEERLSGVGVGLKDGVGKASEFFFYEDDLNHLMVELDALEWDWKLRVIVLNLDAQDEFAKGELRSNLVFLLI